MCNKNSIFHYLRLEIILSLSNYNQTYGLYYEIKIKLKKNKI